MTTHIMKRLPYDRTRTPSRRELFTARANMVKNMATCVSPPAIRQRTRVASEEKVHHAMEAAARLYAMTPGDARAMTPSVSMPATPMRRAACVKEADAALQPPRTSMHYARG